MQRTMCISQFFFPLYSRMFLSHRSCSPILRCAPSPSTLKGGQPRRTSPPARATIVGPPRRVPHHRSLLSTPQRRSPTNSVPRTDRSSDSRAMKAKEPRYGPMLLDLAVWLAVAPHCPFTCSNPTPLPLGVTENSDG